jgi:hypothetical protein
MMTTEFRFKRGDTVKFGGGIAAWIVQPGLRESSIIMVGDDEEFWKDNSDLTPISPTDFCGSCGQVGCAHG